MRDSWRAALYRETPSQHYAQGHLDAGTLPWSMFHGERHHRKTVPLALIHGKQRLKVAGRVGFRHYQQTLPVIHQKAKMTCIYLLIGSTGTPHIPGCICLHPVQDGVLQLPRYWHRSLASSSSSPRAPTSHDTNRTGAGASGVRRYSGENWGRWSSGWLPRISHYSNRQTPHCLNLNCRCIGSTVCGERGSSHDIACFLFTAALNRPCSERLPTCLSWGWSVHGSQSGNQSRDSLHAPPYKISVRRYIAKQDATTLGALFFSMSLPSDERVSACGSVGRWIEAG